MAEATNEQVQTFVNERVRPSSEVIVKLYHDVVGHLALIGDVYENVSTSSTFVDERTDGPPHLATPNDVLAWNTFMTDLVAYLEADLQWPVIQTLCVREFD
jgi:hypothetical protein